MEFETVEKNGRVYVFVNGVGGHWFTAPTALGYTIYEPKPIQQAVSLEEAVTLIAEWTGNWYTAAEAAERLVELGACEKATAHDVCMWARNGLLPGAVKIKGKDGAGQGGSWRIPEAALTGLAEGRGN